MIVGRNDRVKLAPFGLRERHCVSFVDLVGRLWQDGGDDAGSEIGFVDIDARSDLHALGLPIGKDRRNEALVAIDQRGE